MMTFGEWLEAHMSGGEVERRRRLMESGARGVNGDSDTYRDNWNWLYMRYQDEIDARELARPVIDLLLGSQGVTHA